MEKAGTTPRRKLGYALVALGIAALLVGGVLKLGNVTGSLPTFPYAGSLAVCVGAFLEAIGVALARGTRVLDGLEDRRTSLVVVLLALLLFGPMLVLAALLFAECVAAGASPGLWLGSLVFLLLSIALVSALVREIVLRFYPPASAPPRSGEDGRSHLGWRALRIGQVIDRIQAAIEALLASRAREKVSVFHFGATDIHPGNLAFVICVQSDAEKMRLSADDDLWQRLRSLLDEYDYPEKGRAGVGFDIESQQTVDRESGGNWWHHYK